jgi:hypothetical protein
MNPTVSVEGCSSCGALFEAGPHDRGLCADCRQLLASDVPSDSGPRKEVGRPAQVATLRPRRRRGWRRIAIGAAVALVVGGAGAFWMMRPQKTSPVHAVQELASQSWTSGRRHASALWTDVQRHATQAWLAVRRHTPWDKPETPARAPARDATASREKHKRSK